LLFVPFIENVSSSSPGHQNRETEDKLKPLLELGSHALETIEEDRDSLLGNPSRCAVSEALWVKLNERARRIECL
jgi:hypothetical protein